MFNKINIEISNICNLKCSFCPEVKREKGFMSPQLFAHVISEAKPLTEQVCLHLMGEPLAHPKLDQLIAICESESVAVFFVTNGTLLRPRHFELLINPVFRQVSFSLHSFFDNYPDADPTVYLNRIFEFIDYAQAKRPELYLNFRLWNLNSTKKQNLPINLLRNSEMLARVCDHYHISVPGSIRSKDSIDSTNFNEPKIPKVSASAKEARKKKSFQLRDRLYLHFDNEFIWPSLEAEPLSSNGSCYGLQNHIGVLVDATVVPCCLDKEGNIALGNLKDSSLISILQSDKAIALKAGFASGKLIDPLCQRCHYVTRFKTKLSKALAPKPDQPTPPAKHNLESSTRQ